MKEGAQTNDYVELKSKLMNVPEQNEMLQELLKQQDDKLKSAECELVNLKKEKREKCT